MGLGNVIDNGGAYYTTYTVVVQIGLICVVRQMEHTDVKATSDSELELCLGRYSQE